MKTNFLDIRLFIIILLLLNACGNDHAFLVSENIQESKDFGVFIMEYQIKNIETIDHSYCFPFQTVWLEKTWYEDLTTAGNSRHPMIDSTACPRVVFGLKDKHKIDCLTGENYFETWELKNEFGGTADLETRKIYNEFCQINNDTISYTIYLIPHYASTEEELVPIFRFDLVKNKLKSTRSAVQDTKLD